MFFNQKAFIFFLFLHETGLIVFSVSVGDTDIQCCKTSGLIFFSRMHLSLGNQKKLNGLSLVSKADGL